MKKFISSLGQVLPLMALLSSCEFIGGVFRAGVNVGVFLVLLVMGVVIYAAIKMKK